MNAVRLVMADDDDFDEELLAAGGRSRKRRAPDMNSDDDSPAMQAVEDPGIRKKRGRLDSADIDSSQHPGSAQAEAPEDEDEDYDSEDDSDNDYDGLAEGPEDRKMLARMPELQREMLLSERAERRQKERERSQLLSQLGGKPAGSESANKTDIRPKRRAAAPAAAPAPPPPPPPPEGDSDDDASLDDQQDVRRSSRKNTTKMSKVDVLQKMKETRQRKDEAREELTRALEEEELSAGEPELGAESDFSDAEPDSAQEEEDEEAPFDEVRMMQVKRQMIEEWIKQPDLDNTLIGCLVRVSVAAANGQQIYSMCPVVDVTSGKPYKLPATNKETDKYLVIENTQRMQTIAVSLVSNSDITKGEFQEFHTYRANEGQPQLSMREVEAAKKKILQANNYSMTPEDLSRMLAEKRSKGQVRKTLASQKADLLRQKEVAEQRGQTEDLERIEQKLATVLAAIEEKQNALRGLNSLNQKARLTNYRGLNASNNYVGQAALKAAGSHKAAAAGIVDPYSRKATRPMQYWSTSAEAVAKGDVKGAISRQQSAQGELANLDRPEQLRRLPFHIDTTLMARSGLQSKLAKAMLGPAWRLQSEHTAQHHDVSNKRLLTPAEYQQLSGARV